MSAPAAVAATCTRHPERPAVARCMGCDTRLCRGCDTSWQGIHYCVQCLGERRDAGPRRVTWPGTAALAAAVAVLLALVHLLRLLDARFLAGLF